MDLGQRLQLQDLIFWAVVLGVILLSAIMVLPFAGAIISAYILAYFIRPLFLKLRPHFGDVLAALLCILITCTIVLLSVYLIYFQISTELAGVPREKALSNIIDPLAAQPFLKSLNLNSVELKASINLTIDTAINSFIQSIPSIVLGLVITLNGMFYLLYKWDQLSFHIKKYLPFENTEKIIVRLAGTTDAIIHGHGLISLLEGAIAFIAFSLIGVQASMVFAVLIFVLSFIPSVGPILIWGPMAIYYFSTSQYAIMWGVIVTGIILMVGIEFIFYTRFVGIKSRIHPFILLVGVFGGISVFGVFGFIIGPLLLANSIQLLQAAVLSNEDDEPDKTKPAPHLENKAKPTHHLEPTK